ncbi:MAG: MGMT family protein [Treponema sp.]|nr:MGMT family protein [Treponema sp.]
MTDSTRRIMEQLLAIPQGRVSCYRDIAAKAGLPNGARQVVRVLHALSEKHNLPWYRVIRSNGSIALEEEAGKELQMSLLRAEGVEVSSSGRIDMERFGI